MSRAINAMGYTKMILKRRFSFLFFSFSLSIRLYSLADKIASGMTGIRIIFIYIFVIPESLKNEGISGIAPFPPSLSLLSLSPSPAPPPPKVIVQRWIYRNKFLL